MLSPVKSAIQVITLASTAMMVACETPPKGGVPTTDHYRVTAYRTPFFLYGPAQATGADFVLMKDQNVTLIKRSYGYSQIMTADGQSGYVATDDIGPAPAPTPTPKPKKIPVYENYPPLPEPMPGDGVKQREFEPTEGLPTLVPNPPAFRY